MLSELSVFSLWYPFFSLSATAISKATWVASAYTQSMQGKHAYPSDKSSMSRDRYSRTGDSQEKEQVYYYADLAGNLRHQRADLNGRVYSACMQCLSRQQYLAPSLPPSVLRPPLHAFIPEVPPSLTRVSLLLLARPLPSYPSIGSLAPSLPPFLPGSRPRSLAY